MEGGDIYMKLKAKHGMGMRSQLHITLRCSAFKADVCIYF